jgi:DNA-binding CsgD family transcriptional regulator
MMLHITPHERRTLRMLAMGTPAGAMASQLGTSEFALEIQLRTLFARMGAASAEDAVAMAVRRGLLSFDLPVAGADRRLFPRFEE